MANMRFLKLSYKNNVTTLTVFVKNFPYLNQQLKFIDIIW